MTECLSLGRLRPKCCVWSKGLSGIGICRCLRVGRTAAYLPLAPSLYSIRGKPAASTKGFYDMTLAIFAAASVSTFLFMAQQRFTFMRRRVRAVSG